MAVVAALTLSATAEASSVREEMRNGVLVCVEGDDMRRSVQCGDTQAAIAFGPDKGDGIGVGVIIWVGEAEQRRRYILRDEVEALLPATATLPPDDSTGCLSGDGGIGLIFPDADPAKPSTHIQIDASGRVHTGFDRAGFALLTEGDRQP